MTSSQRYNFDEIIERRGTDSIKWQKYGPDVIPMWVADMDFPSPTPVIEALQARAAHGIFGYTFSNRPGSQPEAIIAAWRERFARKYDWQVGEGDFLFVEGIVNAIYAVFSVLTEADDSVLILSPNYWPFFSGAKASLREAVAVPMRQHHQDGVLRFEVDYDALEAAITPHTRLFMFGNPHNPIGRAYERWELERVAEICLRHDLIICSDEIHQELVLDGRRHIPMASISPEIAQRCITLTSATKAFNIAGLRMGIAVSQNHELLSRLYAYYERLGSGPINIMGATATQAALEQGKPWLDALLPYLQANRDYAVDFVRAHMPGVVPVVPEATCLMFLDCRESGIEGDPCAYLLEKARVALSGEWDTQGCGGFVRLNFGCPRPQLAEALRRMADSLRRL